ncbi:MULTISPECIES: hypothetical protein [Agrobacterium]|uniref:Uncharacterized protein n=1 Tax=Agrobacterium tumefaciens TaxID=358 RepID=A0AAE6BCY5_AGRTU|nr:MULTISPECIES: hypothetical protein [Agrobacterium]QCL75046.1 hypothetical protein CFBP5499_16085 [Agrobacterium tumefaciens]QCL80606.1 hypothetical protein CFBP5877_15620 [Agrobacterium tumefaciens]CUX63038.1 hypothetical protein AGR6A_Lc190026 [Agrobacterium sp. NCPPB 925]
MTVHEDLHKNRLAEVKAVEVRADERLKSIETDVRKLNGITDNLNYRLTSNKQATSGITEAVKEIQKSFSLQSGDLQEINLGQDREGAAPVIRARQIARSRGRK